MIASQETSRVERSPRSTPRISSTIAAAARIISGNAGEKSGIGKGGILGQARAAQPGGVSGGVDLLDQVIDRSLDRRQE